MRTRVRLRQRVGGVALPSQCPGAGAWGLPGCVSVRPQVARIPFRIEVDDRTEAYLRVLQQKVTSDTQIVSRPQSRALQPLAKWHLEM